MTAINRFVVRPCELCGGSDFKMAPHTHVRFKDGGEAGVFICHTCAMTPYFSTYPDEHRAAFSEGYYLPDGEGHYTFFSKNAETKKQRLRELLDMIDRQRPLSGARLLDVGCGEGALLEAARERGATVKGIELAPDVVARLNARGYEVFGGLLEDYVPPEGEKWDVATLYMVIDAMMHPMAELRRIRKLMADDGALAILTGSRYLTPFFTPPGLGLGGVVPRLVRPDLERMKPHANDWNIHPFFFTRNSLTAMLAVAGFKVAEITSIYHSGTSLVARPADPVPLAQTQLDDPKALAKDFERWELFDTYVRPAYKALVAAPIEGLRALVRK
jgi:SAM-dependent methyltransferase